MAHAHVCLDDAVFWGDKLQLCRVSWAPAGYIDCGILFCQQQFASDAGVPHQPGRIE